MTTIYISEECKKYIGNKNNILTKSVYTDEEIKDILTNGSMCVLGLLNSLEKSLLNVINPKVKTEFIEKMKECKNNKITLNELIKSDLFTKKSNNIYIGMNPNITNAISRLQQIIITYKRNLIKKNLGIELESFESKNINVKDDLPTLQFVLSDCFTKYSQTYLDDLLKYVHFIPDKEFNDIVECQEQMIHTIIKVSLNFLNKMKKLDSKYREKYQVLLLVDEMKDKLSKYFDGFYTFMLKEFKVNIILKNHLIFDTVNMLIKEKKQLDLEFKETDPKKETEKRELENFKEFVSKKKDSKSNSKIDIEIHSNKKVLKYLIDKYKNNGVVKSKRKKTKTLSKKPNKSKNKVTKSIKKNKIKKSKNTVEKKQNKYVRYGVKDRK